MLKIKNLKVSTESDVSILNGLNLAVGPGEVHAIMGPNGSGKSTLASVIAGDPKYIITEGGINFLNEDIKELEPEERAALGLFLSFQYPIEIPGISLNNFIKTTPSHYTRMNVETFGQIIFSTQTHLNKLNFHQTMTGFVVSKNSL